MFLRIPPFPGHRAAALGQPASNIDATAAEALCAALRTARVGGSFWAPQPLLPQGCKLLLAPDSEAQLAAMLAAVPAVVVAICAPADWPIDKGYVRVPHLCDPWQLTDQVNEVWAGADHELALVAALNGRKLRLFGSGRFAGCDRAPAAIAAQAVGAFNYASPFDGSPWSIDQTIAQLAEWRQLIDSNRNVAAIYGVAQWKRVTLNPLLWNGRKPPHYVRKLHEKMPEGQIIAWKSRTASAVLDMIEQAGVGVAELEDGFIRSSGLGANCVPPLSIIVDSSGVYFDPSGPSDLETLLETVVVPDQLISEARSLREKLVQAGISKYGQEGSVIDRPATTKRQVLVTGQVEDDRSMLTGGAGCSNLDLVRTARALEGDAWLIYKPHPDVEAGHRKGHVPDADVLQYANVVERTAPITALIDQVHALHCITSLAGFEALLRGKQVTVHGVPFYAGWGLTRDLTTIPARRTRKRTLDELVAIALLLYPRYLDPVTRLPCSASILVDRMANGQARVTSPLVFLREWQGRLNRIWQLLTGGRA